MAVIRVSMCGCQTCGWLAGTGGPLQCSQRRAENEKKNDRWEELGRLSEKRGERENDRSRAKRKIERGAREEDALIQAAHRHSSARVAF